MATLIRGSFIILVLLLHCKKVMCRPEIDEFDACSISYTSLAKALLYDDRNFYTMQSMFFPPISTSPVFVAVTYVYNNSDNSNKTFFLVICSLLLLSSGENIPVYISAVLRPFTEIQ